jgi:hypothetical protein
VSEKNMGLKLSNLIKVGVWIVPLVPGAIVAHRVFLLALALEFWGTSPWFPLILAIAGGVAYELMAIGAGHALVNFYAVAQWDRFTVAAVVIGFYLWGGLSEVGLTLLGSFFVVAPFMYILQFFQEEIEKAAVSSSADSDFELEQQGLDREAERKEREQQAAFEREEKRQKRQDAAERRAENRRKKATAKTEVAGEMPEVARGAELASGDSPEVSNEAEATAGASGSSKRWGDLLPEEVATIAGMKTAEIKTLYPGKSDRTYREWKRQAVAVVGGDR